MKIITWNCNGAFRKKFNQLLCLNADIYVIEECEDPANTNDEEYKKFASNYLWIGDKNKGLGIFAKDSIKLVNNNLKSFGLEWFLSCKVNDKLTLFGVWGKRNYIEEIYVYLQIYKKYMSKSENILICGDFNSNSIWDDKHNKRCHTNVVRELQSINLYSYYHLDKNEIQGKETIPTFYQYKRESRGYHIDYFFGKKDMFQNLKVGEYKKWITLSDHMPIMIDYKLI
ncbi:MAG: hypothetical protein PUE01_00335 [Clostridiaceae bacterium]|nr:hypothetical protein [Clostridiaceae bacterium]